jgi:hypothetical protein
MPLETKEDIRRNPQAQHWNKSSILNIGISLMSYWGVTYFNIFNIFTDKEHVLCNNQTIQISI